MFNSDNDRYNSAGIIIISLLAFAMLCFLASTLALAKSGTDSTAAKLKMCEEAGYKFVVDGNSVENLDEECVTNAFLRYNIIYDEVGKKVVMTTAPRGNTHVVVMP